MEITVTGAVVVGVGGLVLNAVIQYVAAVRGAAKLEGSMTEKFSSLTKSVDNLRSDTNREFADVKKSNSRAWAVLDRHTSQIGYLFGAKGLSPAILHDESERET